MDFVLGSGKTPDLASGNNAILMGSIAQTGGFVGNGFLFKFNPLSYLHVNDAPNLNFGTGELTIDAWINKAPGESGPSIVLKGDRGSTGYVDFGFGNNGQLRFEGSDASLNSVFVLDSLPFPNGCCHHAAATLSRDGSGDAIVNLYIDGVVVATGGPSPVLSLDSPGEPLLIGLVGSGTRMMDEVEIFNRALAGPEIAAIHAAGTAGKCKPGDQCVIVSGNQDNYDTADGPELSSPSADFLAFLGAGTQRHFDDRGASRSLVHTFDVSNVEGRIVGAKLYSQLRPIGDAETDIIGLLFNPLTGPEVWLGFIGNPIFPGSPGFALPGIQAVPWIQADIDSFYSPLGLPLEMNLRRLQDGFTGTRQNLVDDLQAQRFLDVLVQPATEVDYLLLCMDTEPYDPDDPDDEPEVEPGGSTPPGSLDADFSSGMIDLTWGSGCRPGVSNYSVYGGTLGGPLNNHEPITCSTSSLTSYSFPEKQGVDEYFLAIPRSHNREGSHGLDSSSVERSQGVSFCFLQDVSCAP